MELYARGGEFGKAEEGEREGALGRSPIKTEGES